MDIHQRWMAFLSVTMFSWYSYHFLTVMIILKHHFPVKMYRSLIIYMNAISLWYTTTINNIKTSIITTTTTIRLPHTNDTDTITTATIIIVPKMMTDTIKYHPQYDTNPNTISLDTILSTSPLPFNTVTTIMKNTTTFSPSWPSLLLGNGNRERSTLFWDLVAW